MVSINRPILWTVVTIILGCIAITCGVCWLAKRGNGEPRASGSSEELSATPTTERDKRAGDGSVLTLPESERSYIWKIEHFVFLLDFRFWPRLGEAIRERDADRAQSFFAAEAHTELINPGEAKTESLAFGKFRTAAAATAGCRPVPVRELVNRLIAAVGEFVPKPQVSIKTVFLSPEDREHMDGPWHGRFLMRVSGQSQENRPTEIVLEADFQMAAPAEEVPNPSPWLASCKIVQESFSQADDFLLSEVGRSWGFDRSRFHDNWQNPATPRVMTGGVYLTDYDLDGQIDVLVTDIKGNVLYHQVGPGKFEDATWLAGLDDLPPGGMAAWADLDGDGYPDLIVGNQLFQNVAGKSFTRAGTLNLSDVRLLHGFAIADYDRDGLLDIYVTRLAPDPLEGGGTASWIDDRSGPGNTLLRNLGNWQFEDVTATTGSSAGNVSCLAATWLDVNGDMWPDLFVGDEFGSPVLLVNRKDGTFESHSITGSFGGFNMGVASGDLDDDGRVDLYMANMYSKAGERVLSNLNLDLYPPQTAAKIRHIVDGSELWHNSGDLRFESKGRVAGVARVGWAYGPCLADLDNDGRLDIYAPAGFHSVSRSDPDG